MKKRTLITAVVVLLTAVAGANAQQTWTVGDIAAGSNIENLLAITAAASNWTNSHIEIGLSSGSIINYTGSIFGVAAACFSSISEDTGCYPISASVAYHAESSTYVETDWGVTGGLASLDPAYVVTLTPDAVGTWYLKSWFLDASNDELSGAIAGGILVPEPATMSLIVLGAALLIRRRR